MKTGHKYHSAFKHLPVTAALVALISLVAFAFVQLNEVEPPTPAAGTPSNSAESSPKKAHIRLYDLYENENGRLHLRSQVQNSDTQSLLDLSPPEFEEQHLPVTLVKSGHPVQLNVEMVVDPTITGFVVEPSSTPDFSSSTMPNSYWQKNALEFTFTKPGVYYYRVRGMNEKQELTHFSKPLKIEVKPAPVEAQPRQMLVSKPRAHRRLATLARVATSQRAPIPASESAPDPDEEWNRQPAATEYENLEPVQAEAAPRLSENPTVVEDTFREEEDEVPLEVALGGKANFTTLNAYDSVTNTRATLNSNVDFSFSAAWKQRWAQSFSTYFDFTLRKIDFEPSTNRLKTLEGMDHTLTRFTLGAESVVSERARLDYGVSYGPELFAQGLDSTMVVIDQVNVPTAFVSGDYVVYRRGKLTLGLATGASYHLGSSTDSYSVDSGYSFMGAFSLRRDFDLASGRLQTMMLQLGYRRRNQNTSVVEIGEQNIFVYLTFGFPIFDDRRRKPLP